MSAGTLVYLAAMAAMFVAQRLLAGQDSLQTAVTILALLGLGAAAVLRFRQLKQARDPGLRFGHRVALMFLLVGAASLVMYAATTDSVVRGMTLGDEAEDRWLGVWRSLWPIVWLLGTVPLLVVDYTLESSPVVTPRRRVQEMATHGVVAALGMALVFPMNYVVSKRNDRWDLAYFKTPIPGTATEALVESLEQPVNVRIFMPPSSEVAQELRTYFAELEGPKVTVEMIDQAAHPGMAKALAVRNNGVVAFTVGEVDLTVAATPEGAPDAQPDAVQGEDDAPKPITRTLSVDEDFDKAKRSLKKLDHDVQRILVELGHGERIAYVTTGHGELHWNGQGVVDREIKGLKRRLEELGFSVRPLGVREGLAEKVPEDADVVLVLGPHQPFHAPEADALGRYVDAGGSVLIAMEPIIAREGQQSPQPDPLEMLVEERMGLTMGEGVLAAEQGIVPITHNKLDRLHLVTNAFTSHASTRTIAELASQLWLFMPAAGHLEQAEGHAQTVTFTVRSLAVAWADLEVNGDFEEDKGESKGARNVVAAVEGGSDGAPWRAVTTSDASMFSDLAYGSQGNQLFVDDTIRWLIGAEALSGTTENEEDVKIEHTKEGQTTWFYLTVLGIPLGVLLLGALRIRMRRKPGKRAAHDQADDQADDPAKDLGGEA